MEYLVHAYGKTEMIKDKAYVVKADSEEAAQQLAAEKFENEFGLPAISVATKTKSRTKKTSVACGFMLIAIVLAMFKYPMYLMGFIRLSNKALLQPSLQSCLWAIAFYCVFVIRFKGIKRVTETPLDVAMCFITIVLISTFFTMLLETKVVFGLKWLNSTALLTIGLIASVLGVKFVSAGCMAVVMLVSVFNITVISDAMGFWGVLYIMCAFIGILLYLSVEPATLEAWPQIKRELGMGIKGVKNDFSEAGAQAKSIIEKLPK